MLAVATVVVSDQSYVTGEAALVEAANAVPTWVGWPFRIVMQLGTLWVALVVVGGLAWWTRRAGMLAPAAAAVAVAIAFRTDNWLKDVVDRPRPSAVLDGLEVREHIGGFGFPSGHTTMAVALAAALQPALPRPAQRVAWALAAVVAVTRMHVGAHWPADLVGGAALGVAIGAAAWLVVDRLPACWFAPPERPGPAGHGGYGSEP